MSRTHRRKKFNRIKIAQKDPVNKKDPTIINDADIVGEKKALSNRNGKYGITTPSKSSYNRYWIRRYNKYIRKSGKELIRNVEDELIKDHEDDIKELLAYDGYLLGCDEYDLDYEYDYLSDYSEEEDERLYLNQRREEIINKYKTYTYPIILFKFVDCDSKESLFDFYSKVIFLKKEIEFIKDEFERNIVLEEYNKTFPENFLNNLKTKLDNIEEIQKEIRELNLIKENHQKNIEKINKIIKKMDESKFFRFINWITGLFKRKNK